MCGICGIIDFKDKIDEAILDKMVKMLSHRGPDNQNSIIISSKGYSLGLGHARLSILDLSSAANQPMKYKDFYLVFNGEIYNFKKIQSELIQFGHHFKTNSDTEVILHAFEQWGTNCVERFIGMFAFVLYNDRDKVLYLFRDRAGVKPLYYYWSENTVLFASELKALYQNTDFIRDIDERVLGTYFSYGYVEAPHSIFKKTFKLEPGTVLIVNLSNKSYTIKKYWDVNSFYLMPKLKIDYVNAKSEIHELLKSAFNYRMVSDVPVGVFLSGGFDSSAVAAILQKECTDKIKTFTIGFDQGNNEAPYAKATAAYLGTDHYEYYCSKEDAQSIIPLLPFYYDEPFADSSAIPTILVSQLAKKYVTVALSADGGDEVFGGYNSHISLTKRLRQLQAIPDYLKPYAKGLLSFSSKFIPSNKLGFRHKLIGLSSSLNSDNLQQASDLFRMMVTPPESFLSKLFVSNNGSYRTKYQMPYDGFTSEVDLALATDYQMYLPNDILTKVDRATMSVSLEGRDPFLDHRIIEFVARLPVNFKLSESGGKYILKDIVYSYIPKTLMDRPKAGFEVPIYHWLKGDLSFLLEEFLSEGKIRRSGFFSTKFCAKGIKLFKNGNSNYNSLIWKLLMFQMWYEKWM